MESLLLVELSKLFSKSRVQELIATYCGLLEAAAEVVAGLLSSSSLSLLHLVIL
jgi:hypothetical protein